MVEPKEAAAPADAATIIDPTQICRTPKQKTKALFHHEVFFFYVYIFLIVATGSTGKSGAIFYNAYLNSFFDSSF